MVPTTMVGGSSSKAQWNRAAYLDVGRVLRLAENPLTAGEIAEASGRDQSNTKKLADEMASKLLLIEKTPPATSARPGRRATVCYSLHPNAAAGLEEALADTDVPGQLRRGQQLVIVKAPGSRINELQRILAEAAETSRATWTVMGDGPFQGHALAFDDRDGDGSVAAGDLMSKLNACEIAAERVTIVDVMPGHEFATQVKRRSALAAEARKARRARQPNSRLRSA